ncbi:MAG: hypothetical protein ACI4KF_11485 [Huintestinicola sp.]
MKKTVLSELNEKYRDCPVRTNRYSVDGKEYIVHSHFCGNKDIDKVISTIALTRAMSEVFEKTEKIA